MTHRETPGFWKKSGVYDLRGWTGIAQRVFAALIPALCSALLTTAAESAETAMRLSYLRHQALLDPVTSFELLGGPNEQAVPAYGNLRAQASVVNDISRALPAVWQVRVPEQATPGSVRAQYQLTAANGKAGRLSHVDSPAIDIPVSLRPLPVRIVKHETIVIAAEEPADENPPETPTPPKGANIRRFTIIEGGVALSFHPGHIRYAGEYAGVLTIVIHDL